MNGTLPLGVGSGHIWQFMELRTFAPGVSWAGRAQKGRPGGTNVQLCLWHSCPHPGVSRNARGGGQSGGDSLCGNASSRGVDQKLTWSPFSDAKGLSNPSEVETLREKVYATLEAYTKQKYPEQPGR